MATTRIHIEPNIFTWAVERAGKSIEQYKEENADFGRWLDGSKFPTLRHVEQFAKQMYVPLGYMFLKTPPHEECPIPFFRSTTTIRNDINVYDTILTIQERQRWLSGYLRSEGFDKNPLVGCIRSYNTSSNIENACLYIRRALNLREDWAFSFVTVDEALKHLTSLIEDKSVFVCYNGVVGYNNKRVIPVDVCRGFALIDEMAPFIFINNKDAKSAQLFTLLHEFVHVLVKFSAGIGINPKIELTTNESFCDSVAAKFLVSDVLLKAEWVNCKGDFQKLTKQFKVSRYVIARRAKDIGLITESRYFELYNQWIMESHATPTNSSGGAFFPMAIKKTSRTFLIHVNNAISSNKLLHMEAYRLAGLKGDTFHKVIKSPYFTRV